MLTTVATLWMILMSGPSTPDARISALARGRAQVLSQALASDKFGFTTCEFGGEPTAVFRFGEASDVYFIGHRSDSDDKPIQHFLTCCRYRNGQLGRVWRLELKQVKSQDQNRGSLESLLLHCGFRPFRSAESRHAKELRRVGPLVMYDYSSKGSSLIYTVIEPKRGITENDGQQLPEMESDLGGGYVIDWVRFCRQGAIISNRERAFLEAKDSKKKANQSR